MKSIGDKVTWKTLNSTASGEVVRIRLRPEYAVKMENGKYMIVSPEEHVLKTNEERQQYLEDCLAGKFNNPKS